MNPKALSKMRYLNDINTEHYLKSICRAGAAVAPWAVARNGYTVCEFKTGKAQIFFYYTGVAAILYEPKRENKYKVCRHKSNSAMRQNCKLPNFAF